MDFYLAPMEGNTGYIFRNTYHRYYEPMDRYFTPFICHRGLSRRERMDVLPEHNEGLNVIPQILTSSTGEFLDIAGSLAGLGYREVNLNLGCPSGTVVKKGRGAGMLADPAGLRAFLNEIFEKSPVKISIKTRLGMENDSVWPELLEIFSEFPLTELIVHPRIQQDFYKKPVRPGAYAAADEHEGVLEAGAGSRRLCYNGDIFTPEGFLRFYSAFPKTGAVMLGRGILKNPELTSEIKKICRERAGDSSAAGVDSVSGAESKREIPRFIAVEGEYLPVADRERFRKFHAALVEGYREAMDGDKNVLFKMKEFWYYAGQSFPDAKKELKQIKKAQNLQEYKGAVASILRR